MTTQAWGRGLVAWRRAPDLMIHGVIAVETRRSWVQDPLTPRDG